MLSTRNRGRAALVGLAAASTLVLGACGTDTAGSEAGADVQDIEQEPAPAGVFDQPDYADPESFVGQTVTVSAEVNDILSPRAFTSPGRCRPGPTNC